MHPCFKTSLQAILLSVLLSGCFLWRSTDKHQPEVAVQPSPIKNPAHQTEVYVDLIEQEVSKAVSGLKAVAQGVDLPPLYKVALDTQIERLSGISKPTVEYLEVYQKALKQGNEDFFNRDRLAAGLVDERTSAKWKDAEKAKKQLVDATARAEAAEKTLLDMQAKETMESIRKYFLAGGAVFTLIGGGALMAGIWFAIAGLRNAGAVGLAIGASLMALPIFLPTILMKEWFSYSAGAIILVTFGYTAWTFRRKQGCLTEENNTL